MFVILLKFSENKGQAGLFMEGHNEWLKRGFDDGLFLMAGTLQPHLGGAIVAHNTSHEALKSFIRTDPFVELDVVSAEILEILPAQTDERLKFLLD